MTVTQTIYHRYKRYRTLQTDQIRTLPIVILMPHSACNCRCVMCDIWKDNKNLKQLNEKDLYDLLSSLKKLDTRKVVMSGGEALLNQNFFSLCNILRKEGIRVSLLSTGLALKQHAPQVVSNVNDVIVSIDGDEDIHDRIRNIPKAFEKLSEGVRSLKEIDPQFPVTARCVIQKMNYASWPRIIDAAKQMGLDQISFLPADVSSHAFNREVLWSDRRQHEILPDENELPVLASMIDNIISKYENEFQSGFIAESPEKIRKVYNYYAAFYGINEFPYKKCNAPWVSTVIEPDGTVRPCFFHAPMGNIREQSLLSILNSEQSIRFRKNLDINTDPTCVKCVCYLNLKASTRV